MKVSSRWVEDYRDGKEEDGTHLVVTRIDFG